MTGKTSSKSTKLSRKRKAPEASTFTQKYADTVLAPLGREEAATATKLALELALRDGTLRRDRVRIYRPLLRIEKPKQRNGTPVRMIWVRIRDRDQHVVHEVSLEAEKVIEHVIDADANPPFSDEERDDAHRLISQDPELGKLLARKDVGIEWFNSGEHGKGRVIGARLVRLKDHRVIEGMTEAEVELDEGVLHRTRGHL